MKTKIIILSSILLIGCGTRKVQQTKTDVEVKEVISDNTKIETKVETNTKVIDCTSSDEVEIIPIDNTKEIIVNGRVYKNVRFKHRKVKKNVVVVERKKEAIKQQNNIKTKVKSSVNVKEKAAESKKGNFWNWVWLILIIIAVIWFIIWSRKLVRDKEKFNL